MSASTNSHDAIAIVGAGIAGLTAARRLAQAGASVSVFDKGRRVGGRMATRRLEDGPALDHGAQYFTAQSDPFRTQVAQWVDEGVASEWAGRLATINCTLGGCTLADPPGAKERYVGVPAMNTVAQRLAEEVVAAGGQVTTGVRVAPLKRGDGRWRLAGESGEPLGDFAKVLVTAPAPQAAELLTPSPALSNAAKSVRMTGCWAALAVFAEPVAAEFDGAFVNGSPEATPLSWIARETSKPGRTAETDRWVLHGSPAWSEQHLDLDVEEASERLLMGLWRALGGQPSPPAAVHAHRWRFALPANPLAEKALVDRRLELYAAGDWCGGPRVEGAYLSGLAAGEAMLGAS